MTCSTGLPKVYFYSCLVLALLLTGCTGSTVFPPPTATPYPTSVPTHLPTSTPTPSPSSTPAPTPTRIPTSTPIPLPIGRLERITAQNAERLAELGRMGRPVSRGARANGGVLVVASVQGFYVFDLDPLEERLFVETTSELRSIALSPDGQQVITGDYDGNTIIWNTHDGQELGRLIEPGVQPKYVGRLSIDTKGKLLAVNSSEGVAVWDIEERKLIRQVTTWAVYALAFSPDSTILATANSSGSIDLWNLETGERIGTLAHSGMGGYPRGLAFNDNGKLLAESLMNSRKVIVYDLDNRAAVQVLEFESSPETIEFSPDGKILIVSAEAIYVWNTDLWDTPVRLQLSDDPYLGYPSAPTATFLEDARRVVSVSDQHIIVWDIVTGQPIQVSEYGAFPFGTLAFVSDRQLIVATGSGATEIDVAQQSIVQMIDYANDSRALASAAPVVALARGGVVSIFDVTTWQRISAFQCNLGEGLSFSPDGKTIAAFTAGNNATRGNVIPGYLKLRNTTTGKVILDSKEMIGVQVYDVAFSPSDDLLAVAEGWGYAASLWNHTGQIKTWGYPVFKYAVTGVKFSPDGNRLAIYDDGGNLYSYDVGWERTRIVLEGLGPVSWSGDSCSGSAITSLAFSSDSALLAVVAVDECKTSIKIMDWNTGRIIQTISPQDLPFGGTIVFSPDDKILVFLDRDGIVTFWGVLAD